MEVELCPDCGLPFEYCDWGDCPDVCKAARGEASDHEEGEEGEDKPQKKKGGKKGVKLPQKIEIIRANRGGRKFVTVVIGLETHGIDLTTAATAFRKKFACGASVVRDSTGEESIDIQGDVSFEVMELIEAKFNIPEKMISSSDKKKPKKAKTAGSGGRGKKSRAMQSALKENA